MRLAVRRAVGIAGATAVAIGAALTLALPASAHDHSFDAMCKGSDINVEVTLTNYTGSPNTVKVTDTDASGASTTLVDNTDFGHSYVHTFVIANASTKHTFAITVGSGDNIGAFSQSKSAGPCCPGKTTTTTPPPTTTTTVAPPTTTTPPATHSTTPTTTTAVVAAATSTGPVGTASLPFTGANVGLPLGIAGFLVVVGGGLLFWLRFSAKRRHQS